jgi:hypothetical protein
MEIIILKERLLGLKRATAGSTDRKCIERSNDQAPQPLFHYASWAVDRGSLSGFVAMSTVMTTFPFLCPLSTYL